MSDGQTVSDDAPPAGEGTGARPTSRPKGGVRIELFIAGIALTISLCALLVSFYEVRIMNAQQRASVWPYLQTSQTYSGDGFGLTASNNGIGPARVNGVRVRWKGQVIRSWPDFVAAALGPDSGLDYDTLRASDLNGQVIRPGQVVQLFFLPWSERSRPLADEIDAIDMVVCYCSVFDQCWMVEVGAPAQPADRCPIREEDQFTD